jgi:aminopeptidase N
MVKRIIPALVFICCCFSVVAQSSSIDVLHYQYNIELTDESDTIKGKAIIRFKMLQPGKTVFFDLASAKRRGKGMQVTGVYEKQTKLVYTHVNNKLQISFSDTCGSTNKEIMVHYAGVPADGLIIGKNKYGDRTFFSDNWPNRAHQWIPCHDVPNDKASVEFIVTAPNHYQVISNGIQAEETDLDKSRKKTHWKEVIPIPTKVIAIGAARFAVKQYSDSSHCVPVTAWVYPQDKDKGFYDYAIAKNILQFFSDYIGPYAFQKLANVQSKTIFGGMENASAIFYDELLVTGNRQSEALIAHEIAHQWFGNMATEKSFAHLWLSEGFATYLAHIYMNQQYGQDTFMKRLQNDRMDIIAFSKRWNRPVVDSVSALMDLLNANSYEKGSWVLHMLRQEVGDSLFRKIVQTYYQQYKGSNADTWDFKRVAESVWGEDLEAFINQWLFQPYLPKLQVSWKQRGNEITISVLQKQSVVFNFPLQMGIIAEGSNTKLEKLVITKREETFKIPISSKAKQVLLDPLVNLLFEGNITEVK